MNFFEQKIAAFEEEQLPKPSFPIRIGIEGPVGLGKSIIALPIVKQLIASGYSVALDNATVMNFKERIDSSDEDQKALIDHHVQSFYDRNFHIVLNETSGTLMSLSKEECELVINLRKRRNPNYKYDSHIKI